MSTDIVESPAAARHRSCRLPIGALVTDGGVRFRVWAPDHLSVEVVLARQSQGRFEAAAAYRLEPEPDGYFSGLIEDARPGTLYWCRLDDETLLPDPASRFQPEGPHGPSQVVDPTTFDWTDHDWRGVPLEGQVLYEMHIGTFTPEGTWQAALRELPALADLGITVLEVMPVADFPGRFGWGYDGVDLYAPTRLYGGPDDFRRFVDRAHALGMGVILDVVYNHLGPDGNYLKRFAKAYFSTRYTTDWGEALNFDDEGSGPVRDFIAGNAAYWIEEFHLDGLRLDATQDIHDASPEHVLALIARRVREAAGGRATLLVAENEPQQARLVRPSEEGGYGLDMLWNDDFHHSATVALSGRNEAYYSDYLGRPQEFISAAKRGWLYQGQWYRWQKQRRGTSTKGLGPAVFVTFMQNHDQIANTAQGYRCHAVAGPGVYKALTALLLLGPGTPMLFQGQEFAASSRFFYFADHKPELAKLIDQGRKEFMSQFPSLSRPESQAVLLDAAAPRTFERSKLNHEERETHAEIYALHRDLLRLRREDPVFRTQPPGNVDGAVLGDEAFVLRFFGDEGDRLLLVNLGTDLHLSPVPEPLLSPHEGHDWDVLWSSEFLCYGGGSPPPLRTDDQWLLPGHSAMVLIPKPLSEPDTME